MAVIGILVAMEAVGFTSAVGSGKSQGAEVRLVTYHTPGTKPPSFRGLLSHAT